MGKVKVITVSIKEDKEELTSLHYERLGFELISSSLVTCRSEAGIVVNTYYENIYKFDFEQKNAEQLWLYYKEYKKKIEELETRYDEKTGDRWISFRPLILFTVLIAAISFPFIPMLFGNDFGNFYSYTGFLFDLKKTFDFLLFFSSIALALITGFALNIIIQLIAYAFTRKKLMLNAVERIPILQKEIEELTYKAQSLQSQ